MGRPDQSRIFLEIYPYMKPFIVTLFVGASVALTSCFQENAEDRSAKQETAQWNWTQYPSSHSLFIQETQFQIKAKETLEFTAPEKVTFFWKTELEEENELFKGTEWASIDPLKLARQETLLQLQEQILKHKIEAIENIEIPKKRLALEKEKAEIAQIEALYQSVQQNPDMMAALNELYPELNINSSQDLEKALQATAIIAAEEAILNSEANPDQLDIEKQKIDLIESRETQLEIANSMTLKMPFSGTLKLNFPINDYPEKKQFASGALIATAYDLSQVFATVEQSETLSQYPAESLTLELTHRSSGAINAQYFDKQTVAGKHNQNTLINRFIIKGHSDAPKLGGQTPERQSLP